MAYFHERDGYSELGHCGCGANCPCDACKQRPGLAEYYYEGEGRDPPGLKGYGFGRFAGFSGPSEQELFQNSRAAIDAVLKRNPVGGYPRGTSQRRDLEAAFASVPQGSAFKLYQELNGGQSPLAKLFWYRLAPETQKLLLGTLIQKETERIEGMVRMQDELRRKMCPPLKQFEQAVERVCQASGEDSDACQEWRFKLLEAREKAKMSGAQCP